MKWDIHIYDPKSETTTTHVKDYPGTSASMADAPAVVAKASRDFHKHMKYILAVPHREAKRSGSMRRRRSPLPPAQLDREITEALAGSEFCERCKGTGSIPVPTDEPGRFGKATHLVCAYCGGSGKK